jgi:hypothetical protein
MPFKPMTQFMTCCLRLAPLLFCLAAPPVHGAHDACCRTENLVLVTVDGVRWQEVFTGLDHALAGNAELLFEGEGGKRTLQDKLAADSPEEAREKLMPFLWGTLARHGVLLGNRHLGAEFKLSNPYQFSYPGYNEMLTGIPDTQINSNGPMMNPHRSVLELANQAAEYRGGVACFSTWLRFPWILNRERSGIMVNTSGEAMPAVSERVALLNQMQAAQDDSLNDGKRTDLITYYQAFEYLGRERPRVLHIALDEADYYGHRGFYDLYLGAVQQADGYLQHLWTWLQNDAQYRGKTTLIVTTDHGRGGAENNGWKRHSNKFNEDGSLRRKVDGADDVWMAAIGPDTPARGPVKHERLELRQLAPTIAVLLNLPYEVDYKDYPTPEPITLIVEPGNKRRAIQLR